MRGLTRQCNLVPDAICEDWSQSSGCNSKQSASPQLRRLLLGRHRHRGADCVISGRSHRTVLAARRPHRSDRHRGRPAGDPVLGRPRRLVDHRLSLPAEHRRRQKLHRPLHRGLGRVHHLLHRDRAHQRHRLHLRDPGQQLCGLERVVGSGERHAAAAAERAHRSDRHRRRPAGDAGLGRPRRLVDHRLSLLAEHRRRQKLHRPLHRGLGRVHHLLHRDRAHQRHRLHLRDPGQQLCGLERVVGSGERHAVAAADRSDRHLGPRAGDAGLGRPRRLVDNRLSLPAEHRRRQKLHRPRHRGFRRVHDLPHRDGAHQRHRLHLRDPGPPLCGLGPVVGSGHRHPRELQYGRAHRSDRQRGQHTGDPGVGRPRRLVDNRLPLPAEHRRRRHLRGVHQHRGLRCLYHVTHRHRAHQRHRVHLRDPGPRLCRLGPVVG